MKQYTHENITELQPNEIFVFGSNYKGAHGAGAARAAMAFGAIYGQGEGLQGQTYGFPTVSTPNKRLSYSQLCGHMETFMKVVNENTDKIFLLTKIGTGLGGIPMEEMKRVFWSFYDGSENVIYPIEFELTDEEIGKW